MPAPYGFYLSLFCPACIRPELSVRSHFLFLLSFGFFLLYDDKRKRRYCVLLCVARKKGAYTSCKNAGCYRLTVYHFTACGYYRRSQRSCFACGAVCKSGGNIGKHCSVRERRNSNLKQHESDEVNVMKFIQRITPG